MWSCARFRWQMLAPRFRTEANWCRIKTYYRNLIYSAVVTPDGIIVFKLTGNPSGSVNTITDNTIILFALKSYAWIRNCPRVDRYGAVREPSYVEFMTNVMKALCGDDNTFTVSDWANKFYNAKTIIAAWKEIGITATTDSLEPRVAEDLDYLSAHTCYISGVECPVYEYDKLLTSSLYCSKKLVSPAHSLTRVAGILINGWTNLYYRDFARGFIAYLLEQFDEVLHNDEDWIVAKCGVLTDEQLETLWTGRDNLGPFTKQSCQ